MKINNLYNFKLCNQLKIGTDVDGKMFNKNKNKTKIKEA